MAMKIAYCLLISIAIISIRNARAEEKEDFVSDRECPLLCKCSEYDVNCTNTYFFPDNIPKETERFFITNSTFDVVPINAFLNLPKLQEIHFIDCKTTKLRACSFAELENMTEISFENTQIDQIEGNAFANLVNISNIGFYGAMIREMRSFSFHNVKHVERLEFFETQISIIHPFAFLNFENVGEIGIMDSTIQKFLRDGFSRFSSVELIYMSKSVIHEWQCGSMDTVTKAGIGFPVSQSSFTCDCKLAWLWTKHSNSTVVFNGSNKCFGTDDTLASVDVDKMCPSKKSRDQGCPPLLPSTPHLCSRSFDSPMNPVEKVAYPTYFSRNPAPSSAATMWRDNGNIIIHSMFVFLKLFLFSDNIFAAFR